MNTESNRGRIKYLFSVFAVLFALGLLGYLTGTYALTRSVAYTAMSYGIVTMGWAVHRLTIEREPLSEADKKNLLKKYPVIFGVFGLLLLMLLLSYSVKSQRMVIICAVGFIAIGATVSGMTTFHLVKATDKSQAPD